MLPYSTLGTFLLCHSYLLILSTAPVWRERPRRNVNYFSPKWVTATSSSYGGHRPFFGHRAAKSRFAMSMSSWWRWTCHLCQPEDNRPRNRCHNETLDGGGGSTGPALSLNSYCALNFEPLVPSFILTCWHSQSLFQQWIRIWFLGGGRPRYGGCQLSPV